jgi:cation:H+ antiporter
MIDFSLMLGSVVLVWLFSRTKYTVERWEGLLLVVGYLVYVGWLLSNV